MSKKMKFEHNPDGFFELMKSDEMVAILEGYGSTVMNIANDSGHAGDQYEMTTNVGQTRASVKVKAANIHAVKSNLKYNTLLKALGSVRE